MKTYKFSECSCEFECENESKIFFNPNIDNISLDCHATWDLISSGNTKGVFQLESRLGQMLAKKLKPRNIEHLAALIAVMRPGCLEAKRDGKSVTEHFIDRKNGEEEVIYFHPALEPILKETYGEMIYQEQAMHIARDLAGFSLEDADILRKAIGKKLASMMSDIESTFIEGCKKQGIVEEEEAHQIFEWIRKSQRYSFNKSHSISYAINAYLAAYAKAHFYKEFFTSYLYYAKEKINPHDEIRELVNNAKSMDVNIYSPDLRKLNIHFKLISGDIYFGLIDIKGVGKAVITKLMKEIPESIIRVKKPLEDWIWTDFLIGISQFLNKSAVEALIKSGALSWFKTSRQRMWFEFEQYSALSRKEQEWLEKHYKNSASLSSLLKDMLSMPVGRKGGISNKNRHQKIIGIKKLIDNPPISMEDTPEWIASIEESLLGIPITCTVVDGCKDSSNANINCGEFNSGRGKKELLLAVKVDAVQEIITKNGRNPGQKMAFIKISDHSGSLDSCVLFPEPWGKYKSKIFVDNTVMLGGERGREKDTFVVNNVWQI